MVVSLADLRAGKTSNNTSDTPSSGVVRLSDLRKQSGPSADSINARGTAEADEQYQVAHQWDNNPEAQAIINPPASIQPQTDNKIHIPVLDFLNNNIVEPVGNFLNRAGTSAMDALTFGQGKNQLINHPDNLVTPTFEESLRPAQTTVEKTADIIGNLYGSTAPMIGGYATGGKLAAGVFAKLAPNSPQLLQSLVRGAGAGLAYGSAKEGLDAAINPNDKTITDRLKSVGTDALYFAAGDGALSAAGSGIKALRGFADNTATGLTRNAIQNVADNARLPVTSPFAEGAAVGNPIARGYTANVARTFEPNVSESMPKQEPTFAESQYKVGDSAIPTAADGAHLSEPKLIEDIQSKDGVNYYKFEGSNTYMPENMVTKGDVPQGNIPNPLAQQPIRTSMPNPNELKFAQTVKESPNTPPDLLAAMNKEPMTGARTTDVLNHQQASELIKHHGVEGLYGKLMSKKVNFSPSETVAAEMLAKHYGTLGGDANLSKAIDLVAKTSKGGREMGQAIQALSVWNKLDESGVLMLGTKQLNKGVEDITKYKSLTTQQALPLTAAAQRIGSAQETKNLADEVLSIVTNKKSGEALTDAEKATIKQFQDQVKMINEKGKGILSQPKGAKGNATIKEVSQIEPKARTRDQVVSFLDAKAEQARQRIAASRNIGFAAVNKGNPVADYAVIGASHIAKGVVKLSDFTEQMVRDFGDSIKPHINEVFNKATNIFRKENGLPTVQELDRVVNKAVKEERFSPEDANRFKAWASEIGHYADNNLKKEAIQDLQIAMKDLGDSTLGQKIATVQTGSMLLNSVTMERNVLGNAAQLIGDKVSKVVTVPIDWGMSKLTGEQRTIVFNQMNQEKFWKNFMEGTKSGWKGVSPNGQLDSYGVHPNVFGKNNPLKYITKLLGASLQGFDHAFYSTAKGEVLATYAEQLGLAQKMTRAEIKAGMKDLIVQLDDRIHELADHAGRYATYQDETMLSKGAEMLRKGLNEATTGAISRTLVEKGMPQKYSLEGFGAGDVLIKFAKTPANLVMRGIDYSPIGFIRSMMDLGTYVLKREKFNQHEAVRSLGRAITGTLGLTGMGYILADAGILTGSASMDKDVRSIQEQSGQGAYKVNWSALSRFFQSGFNYDAAAYQKGDRLMDYQWLQPAAISVAMGVNANKAVKAHKAGDQTAGWQQAGKALLGGIQTVLENPMVQGLSSVIDAGTDIIKKQDPTKLINIAKGVPATFVPTLSNQARTATDNNQRETFNKSLLTEIGNLMANKVPGLSKNLPISYDSLGNAREKLQGGQENTVSQYLTSFFSPAKLTEYKVSPEAKLVLDLMNQSGDANVLPRIADKSFHVTQGKNVKDLKVSLTAEQFSQLQQETGKMVTEKLSQKADYLANPNIALQHKVDAVKKILSDVGTKARANVGTQMGYKKSAIKS